MIQIVNELKLEDNPYTDLDLLCEYNIMIGKLKNLSDVKRIIPLSEELDNFDILTSDNELEIYQINIDDPELILKIWFL